MAIPHISTNDHTDHVSSDTVIDRNETIGSSWISADGVNLVRCQTVPAVTSFVEKLFSTCCPFTIRRAIAEIIVDPFEGPVPLRSRWTRSHVGKEISKPFWSAPAFANSDAACAIVFEMGVIWSAPSVHQMPDKIFRSLGHAVSPEGDGPLYKGRLSRQ